MRQKLDSFTKDDVNTLVLVYKELKEQLPSEFTNAELLAAASQFSTELMRHQSSNSVFGCLSEMLQYIAESTYKATDGIPEALGQIADQLENAAESVGDRQ